MPKSWFITGTSTGLGRVLTERLLARGDRVAATLGDPEHSTNCSHNTVIACASSPST
ncbi:hypothetical protein [Paraburkholderia fungorum]|uniref:hypothetical protein n=1 Tax=Paraburkholderia fungorum TaxID=134537 RepID=UPI0038BC7FAC